MTNSNAIANETTPLTYLQKLDRVLAIFVDSHRHPSRYANELPLSFDRVASLLMENANTEQIEEIKKRLLRDGLLKYDKGRNNFHATHRGVAHYLNGGYSSLQAHRYIGRRSGVRYNSEHRSAPAVLLLGLLVTGAALSAIWHYRGASPTRH